MNKESQKKMVEEIKKTTTAKQIFFTLFDYYDFDGAKPGGIAKGLLIENIPKLAGMLSVKPKPEHK